MIKWFQFSPAPYQGRAPWGFKYQARRLHLWERGMQPWKADRSNEQSFRNIAMMYALQAINAFRQCPKYRHTIVACTWTLTTFLSITQFVDSSLILDVYSQFLTFPRLSEVADLTQDPQKCCIKYAFRTLWFTTKSMREPYHARSGQPDCPRWTVLLHSGIDSWRVQSI